MDNLELLQPPPSRVKLTMPRRSIGKWLEFYNDERPHQALDYRAPREIFEGEACEHGDIVRKRK
jgi:hypothetical protein